MQSTRSVSMSFGRISRCLSRLCGLACDIFIALRARESPARLEGMLPLARTGKVKSERDE